MTAKKRARIIAIAVRWLDAGLLPDALALRLMREFGLSPGQARDLAGRALRQWKKETAGDQP